jgi:hypothetical protein
MIIMPSNRNSGGRNLLGLVHYQQAVSAYKGGKLLNRLAGQVTLHGYVFPADQEIWFVNILKEPLDQGCFSGTARAIN